MNDKKFEFSIDDDIKYKTNQKTRNTQESNLISK
jgi:hypothetical protein